MAGFHVTGVDFKRQPRYVGDAFVQADALKPPFDLKSFDFIWASPPCHDHSVVTGRNRKASGVKGTGWMLDATIAELHNSGRPWIVENVEGAKWPREFHRVRLCGSMFNLNVRRHRWFASNAMLLAPECEHARQLKQFRTLDSRRKGKLASCVGVHGHLNYPGEFKLRCDAMEIDWMKNDELSQAIPPSYSHFLGSQIIRACFSLPSGAQ